MPQPLKDAFLKVNPDPQKLRVMHDKDAERMRHFQDVGDDQLKTIRSHALIMIGDRDVVKPEHAIELSRLIPQSRLLMLPGGHGDYLGEIAAPPVDDRRLRASVELIEAFLDAP